LPSSRPEFSQLVRLPLIYNQFGSVVDQICSHVLPEYHRKLAQRIELGLQLSAEKRILGPKGPRIEAKAVQEIAAII
jgi:hypothetical protein